MVTRFLERDEAPDLPTPIEHFADAPKSLEDWRAGAWLLRLTPSGEGCDSRFGYEGPFRITRDGPRTRLSGDLYELPSADGSNRDGGPGEPPWFPRSRYRFYLRSRELTSLGRMLDFETHCWRDLRWKKSHDLVLQLPRRLDLVDLDGLYHRLQDGAVCEMGRYRLTWVSPSVRRAIVEIDKVERVSFPEPVDGRSIESAFETALWTVKTIYHDHSIDDHPHGERMTVPMLRRNAETWRQRLSETAWHYYVQCHRELENCTFGCLFDVLDYGDDPARQDLAVAAWAPLTQRDRLQDRRIFYLRTVVHELGGATGLGATRLDGDFMQNTRTVLSQFPDGCFEWSFTKAQMYDLCHRPDPWIRPQFRITGDGPFVSTLRRHGWAAAFRGLVRSAWSRFRRFRR